MLFKFVELDADPEQLETVALLKAVDSQGIETGMTIKLTSWMLGRAFANTPHFRGFTAGQVFEIDVKPVMIVQPGPAQVVPITDGDQIGFR